VNLKNYKTATAFGSVLRGLRLKRKLTQEKLAFECGVARAYISQLELGRQLPSLDTMLALSRGLKIPIGYLAVLVDEKLKEIPDK
jgi:transcriptional regulator with XRE-family HTH domain